VLFNSLEFFIFLPIVFILYWFVFAQKINWQNALILVSSSFFYGWWSLKLLGLLFLITAIDYSFGFFVASSNKKKAKIFLILCLINNLGFLAIFKYYNFFAIQFQHFFNLLGINTNPFFLNLALPIGISFYTFHGMSYVFDIYRGNQKPVKNFIDYAVFVTFFPLLIAGPIERASHLLPQIQRARIFNYNQAVDGCRLILWGLFKKVLIADSLAKLSDVIFQNYYEFNGITLIIGAIAFSFQIYGDFSGYSDIALGSSKLLGFEILSNFNYPYFSRNLAEFWKRWHISLSSWFMDYLYIPLGGSKMGKFITIRNTFIIFIVSGFWHGASWNFIAWGLIHACGFLPLILVKNNKNKQSIIVAQNRHFPNLKELWQMTLTFSFVTFAWIFFRLDSLSNSINYIKHIFNSILEYPNQILMLPIGKTAFVYILPLVIGDWLLRRDERKLKVIIKNALIRFIIYSSLIIIILYKIIFSNSKSFIYFQF
jgi:D-alanyl-lipoteichoic acid acyltransferase DltB (MBOAT superfamily)